MNSEVKFNAWIQTLFPHPADARRIETTTESGMPDLNICYQGMEAWVESKVLYPKGVLLRKEQWAWSNRRANAGGSVFVLAWDEQFDEVLGWKLPNITVFPSGDHKTLVIQNKADFRQVRDSTCKKLLVKFLFPMF